MSFGSPTGLQVLMERDSYDEEAFNIRGSEMYVRESMTESGRPSDMGCDKPKSDEPYIGYIHSIKEGMAYIRRVVKKKGGTVGFRLEEAEEREDIKLGDCVEYFLIRHKETRRLSAVRVKKIPNATINDPESLAGIMAQIEEREQASAPLNPTSEPSLRSGLNIFASSSDDAVVPGAPKRTSMISPFAKEFVPASERCLGLTLTPSPPASRNRAGTDGNNSFSNSSLNRDRSQSYAGTDFPSSPPAHLQNRASRVTSFTAVGYRQAQGPGKVGFQYGRGRSVGQQFSGEREIGGLQSRTNTK